jgi:predicted TIM-barrel fold metal-dependent hydrolase
MADTIERLISADSHVTVTHDQVKARLASKFYDDYDNALAELAAAQQRGAARHANIGMPKDFKFSAVGRPGTWDPRERLKDMDEDGVDSEVLYCEVSAFRYLYLIKNGWKEATRAFNDTLIDFGSVDPKRLITSYQIPIHDVDVAVAEVRRVAAEGGKSLQLPTYPAELGAPDYYESVYDPLWAAIQDADLPICCHLGGATIDLQGLIHPGRSPHLVGNMPLTAAMVLSTQFTNWIMGGVFERFPRLKVVFVEAGVGWVPWWLFIVDDMHKRNYRFENISEVPSFYFHRNVFLTFVDEPFSVERLRDLVGVRNIMWSTDYPHPATTWPNSHKLAAEQVKGLPDDERDLILFGNAARVWNL